MTLHLWRAPDPDKRSSSRATDLDTAGHGIAGLDAETGMDNMDIY